MIELIGWTVHNETSISFYKGKFIYFLIEYVVINRYKIFRIGIIDYTITRVTPS